MTFTRGRTLSSSATGATFRAIQTCGPQKLCGSTTIGPRATSASERLQHRDRIHGQLAETIVWQSAMDSRRISNSRRLQITNCPKWQIRAIAQAEREDTMHRHVSTAPSTASYTPAEKKRITRPAWQ